MPEPEQPVPEILPGKVFDLKENICSFMESKGKTVDQFSDPNWMADFGYLTDMSMHLNDLNIRLKGMLQIK